jgi:ComF family protein
MIREHVALRAALQLGRALARLFPLQECCLCRGHSRGALLCGFCRRDLPRCAPGLDRAGLASTLGLDVLAVRYDYRFPLDVLVTRYKYGAELALAPVLARLLPPPPCPAGPPSIAGADGPVLISVPASPDRIRQRGFDPLDRVARCYAGRYALARAAAVRRGGAPAQASLGARARRANLRGAFHLPRPQRQVLLVDDVLTTGATLAALAAACRAAGAEWVGAVVLARTPAAHELRPD